MPLFRFLFVVACIRSVSGGQEALSLRDREELWRPTPLPGPPLAVEKTWPAPERFEELWAARDRHGPLRLVRGRFDFAGITTESDFVFWRENSTWRFRIIRDRLQVDGANETLVDLSAGYWSFPELDGRTDLRGFHRLGTPEDPEAITFDVRSEAPRPPPPDALWSAWVYAQALLSADPDLPDDVPWPARLCWRARPTEWASTEAAKAFAAGRLGRFLRMAAVLLGDRLEPFEREFESRVGWPPGADPLGCAPIDGERFLLGLVVDLQGAEHGVGDPERLGRAIAASRHFAALETHLRALVSDPRVDTWNRVRALMVLASALRHRPENRTAGNPPPAIEDAAPWLAALPMPAAGRRWLGLR